MDKVTLRFIVDDKEIKIQGNKDDKLDDIFKKFLKESKNNNQIIDFYHN
jgi:translation initiation factor 1 (eIF-1/SUI1)